MSLLCFVGGTVSKAPVGVNHEAQRRGAELCTQKGLVCEVCGLGGTSAEQNEYPGQTIKLPDFEQGWNQMS